MTLKEKPEVSRLLKEEFLIEHQNNGKALSDEHSKGNGEVIM